jgi:hypothetical protein
MTALNGGRDGGTVHSAAANLEKVFALCWCGRGRVDGIRYTAEGADIVWIRGVGAQNSVTVGAG